MIIGPFAVTHLLGRGGMGQVWAGKHLATGLPVALKIITTSPSDPELRRGFENEVRAIAGLDHPGIVWILDTGEISRSASSASNGAFPAGAPYLALEYASKGTLVDWTPATFQEIAELIKSLLDALGHAHARGIIHRDLKPANILRCASPDPRPGWKLTDFGIAAVVEESAIESLSSGGIIGTLSYMSPEQISGHFRDYGPWTDLYALGALMYRVVGGCRMFEARRGPQLMLAQMHQVPKPLAPLYDAPSGFPEWVAKLVQKKPEDRFRSAAEAWHALEALLPNATAAATSPIPEPESDEEATTVMAPAFEKTTTTAPASASPIPLPRDWRSRELPRPSFVLAGAGLGCFDLRPIRFAGRELERERLWGALRMAERTKKSRVVLLPGVAGVGKTRLMQWIASEAHCKGGWLTLHTLARPDEPPDEVLRRPLRRKLMLRGMEEFDRVSRLETTLRDTSLATAAAALLSEGERTELRLDNRAKQVTLRRVCEHIGPAVMTVDDAHNSEQAVAFAEHVATARSRSECPLLVVVAWQREAISPGLAKRLEELGEHERVHTIEVGALAANEHSELIQDMLGFERSLAVRIERRTMGNPMFAIQLVREWAAAGLLIPGPAGFTMKGEMPPITTAESVWQERVEKVLLGLGDDGQRFLEIAAVLGRAVQWEEWAAATDDYKGTRTEAGKSIPPLGESLRKEIVRRLLERNLAERTTHGWAFLHAMTHTAVLNLAIRSRRLTNHHRYVARHLLLAKDSRRHSERTGRHLVRAGMHAAAVPHLLAGVKRHREEHGDHSALGLLAEAEAAMVAAGDKNTRRLVQLWVKRAVLFNETERFDDCERWASKAARVAKNKGMRDLEGLATMELSQVHIYLRRLVEANRTLDRAESLLELSDGALNLGKLHYLRAIAALYGRDRKTQRKHSALAARYLGDTGISDGAGQAWMMLAKFSYLDQEFETAELFIRHAIKLYEVSGDQHRLAEAFTTLGDIKRSVGEAGEARKLLTRAARMYSQEGSSLEVYPRLNLSMIGLASKQWEEAYREAYEAYRVVAWKGRSTMAVAALGVLAASQIGMGDERGCSESLDRMDTLLAEVDVGEPDLVWTLELAADHAPTHLARRILRMAMLVQEWVDPAGVARLQERYDATG